MPSANFICRLSSDSVQSQRMNWQPRSELRRNIHLIVSVRTLFCVPVWCRRFASFFGGEPLADRLPEMPQDCAGLRTAHDRRQRCRVGVLHRLQAAEVLQQPSGGARADAGNVEQLGLAVAHLPPLAMESDGEAVGLVAN